MEIYTQPRSITIILPDTETRFDFTVEIDGTIDWFCHTICIDNPEADFFAKYFDENGDEMENPFYGY